MSEIIQTNQLQDAVSNGSQILEHNRERVEKATGFGKKIIAEIQEKGMSAELDQKCNTFLVKCRDAKKEMDQARKPFTTLLNTIIKEFTTLEASIDVSKSGTEAFIIQTFRNDYVKKLKEAEENAKREAQLKLDVEKEKIEFESSLKLAFSDYIKDHIASRQDELRKTFNAITLEDFDTKGKSLKDLKPVYHKAHLLDFNPVIPKKYISDEEATSIKEQFINEQSYNTLAEMIEAAIKSVQIELIEKLPSLKNELLSIANAESEEKERLAREKADREAREKDEADKKMAAEKAKRDAEIEAQKTAKQTEAMMDAEGDLFASTEESPESRSGYEIILLHQAGAAEVFSYWFEMEGKNLTIDEIEKKSIKQMKSFCEKEAHKTGEMIQSKYLKYEPIYKAVNRK